MATLKQATSALLDTAVVTPVILSEVTKSVGKATITAVDTIGDVASIAKAYTTAELQETQLRSQLRIEAISEVYADDKFRKTYKDKLTKELLSEFEEPEEIRL